MLSVPRKASPSSQDELTLLRSQTWKAKLGIEGDMETNPELMPSVVDVPAPEGKIRTGSRHHGGNSELVWGTSFKIVIPAHTFHKGERVLLECCPSSGR